VHERLTREACRRLYDIAAPAETLAREVGFEDPAYFNRLFKRRTGLTARRWREPPGGMRACCPRRRASLLPNAAFISGNARRIERHSAV